MLILAGVHFILLESRKPDRSFSLMPKPILKNFHSVLTQKQFYTYTLTVSVAAAGLYAYIAGSPVVFMQLFKVTEQQYGWIFAFIVFGIIGSSQLNTLLLRRIPSEKIIVGALLCQAATGILLLPAHITSYYGWKVPLFSSFYFYAARVLHFPIHRLLQWHHLAGTRAAHRH